MNIAGVGKRVRIYIGESDQYRGRPLYMAILERLRSEGCAGATVARGIASFGANSRIHTASILRLSEDLPIVVDWVDSPERVDRVLPAIQSMVESGLITLEELKVVHYRHRPVEDIGTRLRVREVMTRDVLTATPETSLREAVDHLIDMRYRVLPVVDAQHRVVGIVTDEDLVERSGLRMRMDVLRALDPQLLSRELGRLEEDKSVADVMTREVVTVSPEATLAEAAHIMVARGLKRLPVVDRQRALAGMISRGDILRTCSEAFPLPSEEDAPRGGTTVGEVMRADVVTVNRTTSLPELLDAVVSSKLNRALVLDDERRLLGVVTDAELVRRLSPMDHPGVVRVLMNRVPVAGQPPERRRELERLVGKTAEQLMITNVSAVGPDTSIAEAIRILFDEHRKMLPVVDGEGRLLGAVDRADLLRVLFEAGGTAI